MNIITSMRLACSVLLLGLITTTAHADTLSYDAVGNIASRTSAQGTTTYSYDALSRLTAETSPTGTQSYTYDANGNRLSDGLGNYTYAPGSNRITSRYGKAITTDAAGNITADGQGHTYVYNQRGYLSEARLNGVLLASYTYDYRGLRTRKVTTAAAPQGAQVVRYTYDEAHHLIAENSGTGAAIRTYVWRDDTPLAQIDHVPSRRIIYLETDHLNTPRVARDQARNVVWTWDSDAFGATPPNPNPSGAGVVTINLRFPGQYYDQETGLHYNGFRYYHPGMGQYIQPDPIGLRGGTFSTYTYVNNNPVNFNDPSGLCPSCVGAIYGGISGAVGGVITADLSPGNNIFGTVKSAVLGAFAGAATGAVAPWLSYEAGAAAAAIGVARTVGTVAATATVGGASSAVGQFAGNVVTGQPLGTEFSWGAVAGSATGSVLAYIPAKIAGGMAGATVGTSIPFGSGSLTIASQTVQNTANTFRAIAEGSIGGVFEAGGQAVQSQYFPSMPSATQGAAGGFLLYPNKANTNMMQSVYSK